MDTQNPGGLIVAIVMIPFIIVMLVLIVTYARSALKASASNTWPTAGGRVISSSVKSRRSSRSGRVHSTTYHPKIVYEYDADGQHFRSEKINFGAVAGTSSSGWAQGIAERYPEGGAIQVFYNPSNPAEAVLENSGTSSNIALLVIFIVIEAVLVVILISGLTRGFGS